MHACFVRLNQALAPAQIGELTIEIFQLRIIRRKTVLQVLEASCYGSRKFKVIFELRGDIVKDLEQKLKAQFKEALERLCLHNTPIVEQVVFV